MSKDAYTPPALPEDLLPDLDVRIGEVRARWEQAKHQGYAAYQQARAQQAAAEAALARGNKTDHENLLNGRQNLPGVKALDNLARIRWDEARRYKAELDALEAEKAAQQKEAEPDAEDDHDH